MRNANMRFFSLCLQRKCHFFLHYAFIIQFYVYLCKQKSKSMELKGTYIADKQRYQNMEKMYARCGRSGVLLPRVSLGFWHNFGGNDSYERSRAVTHYAYDHGITHFDLANH